MARKVVHLGDQLETLNIHRQRDIEAHRLMDILTEFKEKSKPSCPEFNDATKVRVGFHTGFLRVFNFIMSHTIMLTVISRVTL